MKIKMSMRGKTGWLKATGMGIVALALAIDVRAGDNVAIIVNTHLTPLIEPELSRYIADLGAEGDTVTVREWDLAAPDQNTASQLKEYLVGLVNLDGAVLIGDLPVANFHHSNDWYGYPSTFPCDFYYMSLTNVWNETDTPGLFDGIGGTPEAAIWVSRIKASGMGTLYSGLTEDELVRRYLNKNHRFRTGQLRLADRALQWADEDWRGSTPSILGLADAYTDCTRVTVEVPGITTDRADWMGRWNTEYETEYFLCHSSERDHNPGDKVFPKEVADGDIQRLFWNCWNCSSGNYTYSGYIAGARLFTLANGLLAVASTKSGSMVPHDGFYNHLGNGLSHGYAFHQWFNLGAAIHNVEDGGIAWRFGMTLLGDGTLKLGRYMPVQSDPNDPPVAQDDFYTVCRNVALSVNPDIGVLRNDGDPDANALTAELEEDVPCGTLVLNADGSFQYEPAPGFAGILNFSYRANDGLLDSDAATVTIEVLEDAYVSPTGSHEWPFDSWTKAATNIQAAVDAAHISGTVWVSNGVYHVGAQRAPGQTSSNRVVINKAIKVRSVNGTAVTVIEGAADRNSEDGLGSNAVRCVWLGDGAELDGFTLRQGHTADMQTNYNHNDAGGGVRCNSKKAVVRNCVVSGNKAVDGGGIYYGSLYNCLLTGNEAVRLGGGTYGSRICNSVLTGNTAREGGGALGGSIESCTVLFNQATDRGGGAYGYYVLNSIVYYNEANEMPNWGTEDDPPSISFTCTTPLPEGEGNSELEPGFAAGTWRLTPLSPCVDAGRNQAQAWMADATDLEGNPRVSGLRVDMGAYELPAHVLHVAPSGRDVWSGESWERAKRSIQAAVDVARYGDVVLVSNGVYETKGRVAPSSALTNRVMIRSGVRVMSVNGPYVTTIRGAADPNTANGLGSAAVRCAYVPTGTRLEGFTLEGGHTSTQQYAFAGGGVYASKSGELRQCVITGNRAVTGGGALGGRLYGCVISQNTAEQWGGGAYCSDLFNCTVSGNRAWGGIGGVYAGQAESSIVYHNKAPVDRNWHSTVMRHSCSLPLPVGEGNMNQDPLLTEMRHPRLRPGSPCVNAGKIQPWMAGTTDLDGKARVLGWSVDMGAYEFEGGGVIGPSARIEPAEVVGRPFE